MKGGEDGVLVTLLSFAVHNEISPGRVLLFVSIIHYISANRWGNPLLLVGLYHLYTGEVELDTI